MTHFTKAASATEYRHHFEQPNYWTACAALAISLGCAPSADEHCPAEAELAIVQGSSQMHPLPSINNDDGIGYLRVIVSTDAREEERLCTVSRIQNGKALTAAHCLADANTWHAWIGFDSPMNDLPSPCNTSAPSLMTVTQHHPHPSQDIDILEFNDVGGPSVPLSEQLPSIGASAVLAGFGLTEDRELGHKRFAETTLVETNEQTLVVDSGGKNGACVGDSGGPLLVGNPIQDYRLAGVLSNGSLSCQGRDSYVSLVPLLDFIRDAGTH